MRWSHVAYATVGANYPTKYAIAYKALSWYSVFLNDPNISILQKLSDGLHWLTKYYKSFLNSLFLCYDNRILMVNRSCYCRSRTSLNLWKLDWDQPSKSTTVFWQFAMVQTSELLSYSAFVLQIEPLLESIYLYNVCIVGVLAHGHLFLLEQIKYFNLAIFVAAWMRWTFLWYLLHFKIFNLIQFLQII